MKFVKRIGDGEITIENNDVVELSPQDQAEDWAKEFSVNQVSQRVIKLHDHKIFIFSLSIIKM
jgi:hypothetical protein